MNEPERLETRAELHSGGDSLPERRVRWWGMVMLIPYSRADPNHEAQSWNTLSLTVWYGTTLRAIC